MKKSIPAVGLDEIQDEARSRFWVKVNKNGPQHPSIPQDGNCWIWMARRTPLGYGLFNYENKTRLAHRVAFAIKNNGLTSGGVVCHTCDNTWCVNPSHLFHGKPIDNVRDMIQKGRRSPQLGDLNGSRKHPEKRRGIKNGRAILNPEKVIQMRNLKSNGWSSTRLARNFGVSKTCVGHVLSNRTWWHV